MAHLVSNSKPKNTSTIHDLDIDDVDDDDDDKFNEGDNEDGEHSSNTDEHKDVDALYEILVLRVNRTMM